MDISEEYKNNKNIGCVRVLKCCIYGCDQKAVRVLSAPLNKSFGMLTLTSCVNRQHVNICQAYLNRQADIVNAYFERKEKMYWEVH